MLNFVKILKFQIYKRNISSLTDVVFNEHQNIGLITLNRPKALNSLNLSMIRKIYPVLINWNDRLNLVLLKGEGDKAFCAGGDVKAVILAGLKKDLLTAEFFREEYKLNLLIHNLKVPFVSILNGITMGGGVGLSVHGKFRIATEKTVFAMPETAIGFFPDVGGSYFLPRLAKGLGTFLALSGFHLKGSDVYHAKIATHFCDSKNLLHLQNELLELNKLSINSICSVLHKYTVNSEFLKNNEFSLLPFEDIIQRIFSHSTIEDIFTSLKNENNKWTNDILEKLKAMSPLSLKVTLHLLQKGSQLDMPECLKMEYRLSQHFCKQGSDFYEGVRAVLIDKNRKPKWKHSKVDDVTESEVLSMFQMLPPETEFTF